LSHRILKIKRRYIAVKCRPEYALDMDKVYESIEEMFRRLFGEVFLVDSRLRRIRVKRLDESIIIVSCSHIYLGKVLAAITLVNSVDGEAAALDVITVSGTLRALKRKIRLRVS